MVSLIQSFSLVIAKKTKKKSLTFIAQYDTIDLNALILIHLTVTTVQEHLHKSLVTSVRRLLKSIYNLVHFN